MAPRDEAASDGAGTHSSGAAIGTVKTLSGEAMARHGDGTQVALHKGDTIFEGDVLLTEPGGAVGVVLADGTSLSLGEKGRLVLSGYAYDAGSHQGDAHLSLESGSFALVSGQIAKTAPDAFALKTPTMTIGVRGTGVAGNPSSVALMGERGGVAGEVVITTPGGQTATLNSVGAAATVGSGGLSQQQLSPLQVMQLAGGAGAALPNGGALLDPTFNAAAQAVQQQIQQQQQQQSPPPPPPPPPSQGSETQGPPPGAEQVLTNLHGQVVAQVEQVKKQIVKDIEGKDDPTKGIPDLPPPPPQQPHAPIGNSAPVVSNAQALSANQTAYHFTEADFLSYYRDSDGDPLVRIKILTLPQSGILRLGDQTLATAGVELSREQIATLSYLPPLDIYPNLSGQTGQFLWIAFDGTDYAKVPAVMTVGPLQISVNGLYDGSSETRPVEVTGGSGNDTLIGGTAFDTLTGGAGDDLIVAGPGGGLLDGGSGSNAVSFAQINQGDRTLIVNLADHYASLYQLGAEAPDFFATLTHFDTVIGSAGDDTISGDTTANTLVGGAGADTLTGGGGSDVFRYAAATDSTVQNHDVITDFTTGDRLEFAGMNGIIYDPTYAPGLGGSIAATVAALAADPDITDRAVFFVQNNSGWLYIKGAGSGTSYDGTLIQLQGVVTAPPISALSGVSPVPVTIPDGVLVPTGVLASDGTGPAGQAVLDPTKFNTGQLSLAFDVCLSPQLGSGLGSLVSLTDPNGQPWLDVRVENGQLNVWNGWGGASAATVPVGEWHRLSLSLDGTKGENSSIRLYLDGTLVQNIPLNGNVPVMADLVQGLTVGASGIGGAAALFDNLTVWNVARGPHASNYGQGLVAQWSFNEEGAFDCVSSAGSAVPLIVGAGGQIVSYQPPAVRQGTAIGATGTDDVPSALAGSNAVHLNGNGSAIRSATLFEPGKGDFTIELWAKPDTLSGTQFLFSKEQSGNPGGWGLYLQGGMVIANLPGLGESVLSCPVSGNSWHHFALSREGTALILSVDGVTSTTIVTDQVYNLNNGIPTLIGGRFDNLLGDSQSMLTPSPSESLHGSVAEVRVWSAARDLTQLEADKAHRLSGAEPDLIEYMPLSDRAANVTVTTVRDVVDPMVRADGAGAVTVSGLPVGSRAVDLSGSGSGVVSPTRFEPGTGAFTIELWARADTLTATSMLFAKDQSDDTTGWSLNLNASGHLVFVVPGGLSMQSTGVVTAGSWHHYAVTHSADGHLTLYIDGIASGSCSGVTANFTNGIPSIVGARLGNDSALQLNLDGAVSEVRLWSVERSAAQIDASRSGRLSGTETGLVDYLPLDGTLTEIVPGENSDYRLSHADVNHQGEVQHQAISFCNGSTASAGTTFTVGTGDFTVELWVNPTASGTLLSKGTGFRLALVDGVPTVISGGTIVMQGESLPAESWSHLALTRENGTLCLYVDGVLSRVASGVTGAISSSDPLLFGGNHFSGLMAGLRLWNVARAEDDILNGLHVVSPTGSGLIGSWSGLVDGTASASVTALSDASGHGHTLAFSNGTGLTDGGNPPLARSPVEVVDGEPYHGTVVATTIDGQPPTFTLTTQPQHGTLFLGADGRYVYTPAHGYTGIDAFDITVGNGALQHVQSVAVLVSPAAMIAGASQTVTALSLDGNDSATIASAAALRGLDDNSFTVEAWIKPDSACTAPDGDHVILSKDLGSGDFFSLKIENNLLVYRSHDTVITSTTSVAADQWTHVAVTRCGSDITLFVNGIQIASCHDAPLIDPTKATGGALLVGAVQVSSDERGYYFSGEIASVRLWSQALTESRLADIYNDTVDSGESGLIGLWTGDAMDGANGDHQPTAIDDVAVPVYGDRISCNYSGSYSGSLDAIQGVGDGGLGAAVTYQWSRVGTGTTGHGGTVTVDAGGHFHYEPAADWYGLDSFVVQATGSDGRVLTRAIVVEVKPIQPPTTVTINPGSVESGEGSLGITLVDAAAATANQTVSASLTLDHAAIVLNDTMGVTVTGNGSGSVVVTGSFDRVQAVLGTAVFRPSIHDWTGQESLTVTMRNLSVDPTGTKLTSTTAAPITSTIFPQLGLSDDLVFAVGTEPTSPVSVTFDYAQTAPAPLWGISAHSGGSATLSGTQLTYVAATAHAGLEHVQVSTENGLTAASLSVLCFTDAVENTLTGGAGTLAVLNASTHLDNGSVTIGGVQVRHGSSLIVSGAGVMATIAVGGAVETGGAISVSGGGLTLAGGTLLRNAGTISLSGARLVGAGALNLASGGTLALRLATEVGVALTTAAAAQILIDGGAASASALFDQDLANNGTLTLTAGAGHSAALSVVSGLNNYGTLLVSGDAAGSAAISADRLSNSGQMTVGQDLTVTAHDFGNNGTLTVNATLTLRDDAASAPGSHLNFTNDGLLAGTGTLDLSDADFTNWGYLSPGGLGSAGRLTVEGSMTLGGTSVLALDLAGPASSDHLTVQGGTLTYGGKLAFSILANPTLDTSISVISAPDQPIAGYFTTLWGMDNGTLVVDPLFGDHGLSVALHTATRIGSNATYDSSGETVSDYLIGTGINETVSLKGGADVFVGHGGGNRIGVSALDFHFIDGGALGGNELRWDGGGGSVFDARTIRPEALQHFDLLNLSGGGDAVLDYAHVAAMGGGANRYTGTDRTLLVIGDENNHVQLVGGGWVAGDTVTLTVNNQQQSYTQYGHDDVRVLVDQHAHVNLP